MVFICSLSYWKSPPLASSWDWWFTHFLDLISIGLISSHVFVGSLTNSFSSDFQSKTCAFRMSLVCLLWTTLQWCNRFWSGVLTIRQNCFEFISYSRACACARTHTFTHSRNTSLISPRAVFLRVFLFVRVNWSLKAEQQWRRFKRTGSLDSLPQLKWTPPHGGRRGCRGPPSLIISGYRVSFPRVKRLGRGVDHLPPSSAEVKERVQVYCTLPLGLYGLFWAELYVHLYLVLRTCRIRIVSDVCPGYPESFHGKVQGEFLTG